MIMNEEQYCQNIIKRFCKWKKDRIVVTKRRYLVGYYY